ARAAGCWRSARRASCPAKSSTASALTAATCASEPRWRSAAYRWVAKFARCSTVWMFGGLEKDEPARGFIIEQDREIAEKSGRPPLPIKSIGRAGAKNK